MLISDETYNKLCILLGHMFEMNAIADNVAYNLNYKYFDHMANIYHLSFAHLFPSDMFADSLSDEMLKLNARPVRLAMKDHNEEYADPKAALQANLDAVQKLHDEMAALIETADMRGDAEVRIYLENMLEGPMNDVLKQSYQWVDAASHLSAEDLNIHFEKYTTHIDIK